MRENELLKGSTFNEVYHEPSEQPTVRWVTYERYQELERIIDDLLMSIIDNLNQEISDLKSKLNSKPEEVWNL